MLHLQKFEVVTSILKVIWSAAIVHHTFPAKKQTITQVHNVLSTHVPTLFLLCRNMHSNDRIVLQKYGHLSYGNTSLSLI
jgi:hypothetical protein